jgi:hypothetical protein
MAVRGIYRERVRSSSSHFVKRSGLRWISLLLLVPIGWAKRVWHPVSHMRSREAFAIKSLPIGLVPAGNGKCDDK